MAEINQVSLNPYIFLKCIASTGSLWYQVSPALSQIMKILLAETDLFLLNSKSYLCK